MSSIEAFEQEAAEFDLSAVQAAEHGAEVQRQDTVDRYPREAWPELTLEEYAQGQENQPENFCRWIERQTDQMGSIRGGSARKLIVYKHRNAPGWYFPPEYEDERQAWEAVRAGFVKAFDLADQGRWDEIEEIEPLNRGAALVTKVLWVYFPDELLPINSSANLRHFLRAAGRDDLASDQTLGTIRLNRSLLEHLRGLPGLEDASTKALERFLYARFSPNEGRVIKISPGEEARYWPECRDNGYICVGYDEVGDLREYESKDAFLEAFSEKFAEHHSLASKRKEKADELWLLLDLGVGDRIVANKGTREILAVGTVSSPGYVWDSDREEYKHTVKVDWDENYAREIPPQDYWAFKTVYPLQNPVAAIALGEEPTDEGEPPLPASDELPLFPRIAEALERKKQAVLYGPPGTGKTWHANKFSQWWLERKNSGAPSPHLADTDLDLDGSGQAWLVITKPSEWEWEQLFEGGEEGEVLFRRGRLKRNYDEVSPGDLVFGYTATPAKRIELLARVARLEEGADGKTFVLRPLTKVADGPTWAEMSEDEFLATSEPIRNRMQGTLFKLTSKETERLMALISERDEAAFEAIGSSTHQDGGADGEAGESDPLSDTVEWVTFHPSYSYEDFVEGFRPTRDAGLTLEDGIFKRMCERAAKNPGRTYLLIIDEINRANVTKVLGELITLIETDKRSIDDGDAYAARLPYSKERFVVPPNLFLLGTMNTADRSIKMLDTALRRRFGFVELMPDPSLLESEVSGVPLDALLRALNHRIVKEAGREKQIGHSFMLKNGQPITDENEFADIFRDEIVPLLQEYAVDDYDELSFYIGTKIVDRDELTIDMEILSDPSRLLEALEDHLLGALGDE